MVLAGGLGRRFGETSKTAVLLAGKPLIAWPLEVLASVCPAVVVVCKACSRLPALAVGVERWDEPECPRHPATGMVTALERAPGPVLICAADMPFVTGQACNRLLERAAQAPGAPAIVARSEGRLEPLLCVLGQLALEPLRAQAGSGEALTAMMERLGAVTVDMPPQVTASVNTPEQLAAAAVTLDSHQRPGRG